MSGKPLKGAMAVAALALCFGVVAAGAASPKPVTTRKAKTPSTLVQAKTAVGQFLAPMTNLYLPALKSRPVTGKTVALLQCSTPACGTVFSGAIAAAKALGWNTKVIVYTATPDGVAKAMQAAVDMNPDAVYISSVASNLYAPQLATLKSRNTPVIVSNTVDAVGNGITANVSGPPSVKQQGQLLADWVYIKYGAASNVGVFNIRDFPSLVVWQDAFTAEMKRLCSTCAVSSNNVGVKDIGTNIPSIVVATAQRNPKMNYALFGFGDMSMGVAAALKTAGIDGVKIGGIAASLPNVQALIDGTEDAWVSAPLITIGWKAMDALARYWNNEDVRIDSTNKNPMRVMIQGNIGLEATLPEIVDYQLKFLRLWHLR